MKITLIIASLNSGGAERVVTGLANYWCNQGHEVSIIKYYPGDSFYKIDHKVFIHTIDCKKRSKLSRIFFIIKEIRKNVSSLSPDVVISFIDKTNILSILATQGLSTKVIISERTNPEILRINRFWDILRKLVYKKADALILQNNALRNWSKKIITNDKVFIIPNAIDKSRKNYITSALELKKIKSNNKVIMVMGRLSYEKGHDLLLKSFAILVNRIPNVKLEIIGDGPLKDKLIEDSRLLNISDQVTFHGHLKNPFSVLNKADVFVLPSRLEGFPNALLEAMALGLPSVSFNCNYGPSELITHSENGLLVDCYNVVGMADEIYKLLTDDKLREKIILNSTKVLNDFSEDKVMENWNNVIKNVIELG